MKLFFLNSFTRIFSEAPSRSNYNGRDPTRYFRCTQGLKQDPLTASHTAFQILLCFSEHLPHSRGSCSKSTMQSSSGTNCPVLLYSISYTLENPLLGFSIQVPCRISLHSILNVYKFSIPYQHFRVINYNYL